MLKAQIKVSDANFGRQLEYVLQQLVSDDAGVDSDAVSEDGRDDDEDEVSCVAVVFFFFL